MSLVLAVKVDDTVAMAHDSYGCWGDHYLEPADNFAPWKMVECPGFLAGFCGSAMAALSFKSWIKDKVALAKALVDSDIGRLTSAEKASAMALSWAKTLSKRDEHKYRDDDGWLCAPCGMLLATSSKIFRVGLDCGAVENQRWAAIGAGSPQAAGALEALWRRHSSAVELCEEVLEVVARTNDCVRPPFIVRVVS